tara:strand:+ start:219 stop:362 length:144 start_codon:yes stop_codon:yes gene_type:complete
MSYRQRSFIVYRTRAGDELLQKHPVLTLSKKEIDENNKRIKNKYCKK